jgi:hypothetical protein
MRINRFHSISQPAKESFRSISVGHALKSLWASDKLFRARLLVLSLGLCLELLAAPLGACARPGKASDITDQSNPSLASGAEARGPIEGAARPDLIIVEAPQIKPGTLTCRYPLGSRLVKLLSSDSTIHLLTPQFFAVADPRISSDGTHVLFSGKKTTDKTWQIWEIDLDGSAARQITHCPTDCLAPAYLPQGEIAYTVVAAGDEARLGASQPARTANAMQVVPRVNFDSQIWICKRDGSDARQITFSPGDFQVETVLSNGMILATARSPLLPSTGLPADRELYNLRPDGTALATLRCDHQHPAIRSQAKELADGSVVFVKSSLTSRNPAGELAWVRRGALHNSPLTLPPILAMSPEPLSADQLLVVRESTGEVPVNAKRGLFRFDAATATFGRQICGYPKQSPVEAVPVAAHALPRGYWSTLNPDLRRGYFLCLNARLAEGFPHGRILAKPSRVRVFTLGASGQPDAALGDAPIEEDSSFYIAVPPDEPVRFELLDDANRVLRSQQSWIWVRSGEEHGCVGCHEDHAIAPENRWPMALRRFDMPARLDLFLHPLNSQ